MIFFLEFLGNEKTGHRVMFPVFQKRYGKCLFLPSPVGGGIWPEYLPVQKRVWLLLISYDIYIHMFQRSTVENIADTKNMKCRFTVTCGATDKLYEMEAPDQRSKNEWMTVFKQTIGAC